MKLSYYHIITPSLRDKTTGNDLRIIYSTRTGKARGISNSVWLSLCNGNFEDLPESILTDLLEIELIVPESEDELNVLLNRNASEIKDNTTLYLVVQPTATCQLGCNYCGQHHTPNKLSLASQEAFITRAEQKLKNSQYNHLRIGWFGAEPLNGLSVMRTMSTRFIKLAEKYGCNYSSKIVTNGLSLSKEVMLELLSDHKVNYVEITLDGTQRFHDVRRNYKNGNGSFNNIFKNLIEVASIENEAFSLVVRCNVDKRNFEGVEELLNLLSKHNLQKRISFYTAPVHSWGNDAHKESLPANEYAEWEVNWLARMHQIGFNISPLPQPKGIVCMAVQPDSALIDAHGNLFNCTEVSYVPAYGKPNKFSIGHASTGEVQGKKEIFGDFNKNIKAGKYDCSKCRMLPVCGGHCPKLWHEGIVPCPSPKFNIEKRLLLSYAINKLS